MCGFSLIEAMIATSIFGFVVLNSYSNFTMSSQAESQIMKRALVVEMITTIKSDMGNEKYREFIKTKNTQLTNCILRVENCNKQGSNFDEIPISLYRKRKQTHLRVTGTEDAPVYLSTKGVRSNTENQSYFKLISSAKAICSSNCQNTDPPDMIRYSIQIYEKNTKNQWELRKNFYYYEEITPVKERKLAEQKPQKTPDGLYYIYSSYIKNGKLGNDWIEYTDNLPIDYTGPQGPPGEGAQGPQGDSLCHAENTAAQLSRDATGSSATAVANACNP